MDHAEAGVAEGGFRSRYARVDLLLNQSRFELAERECHRLLADSPDDPIATALLAVCLLQQSRLDGATAAAEQAIAAAPDLTLGYGVLGDVLRARNRFAEAVDIYTRGLGLDPEDGPLRTGRATALLMLDRLEEALADVEAALAQNADHSQSLSLRTTILQRLGRIDEALATSDESLRIDAESSAGHARRGWVLLELGQAAEARTEFAEALRLDPNHEPARAGLVEAIKGTSWWYRQFLRYAFWSSRLSKQGGWTFILGAYVGFRVLLGVMQTYPQSRLIVGPLVALYLALVLVSWLAVPLANGLLRLHRDGKLALTRDDRCGSEIVAATLMTAAGTFAFGLVGNSPGLLRVAIGWVILSLPVSRVFHCDAGWPRATLAGGCGVVAALLAWATVSDGRVPQAVATLLPLMLIGLQFAAIALQGVRPKR